MKICAGDLLAARYAGLEEEFGAVGANRLADDSARRLLRGLDVGDLSLHDLKSLGRPGVGEGVVDVRLSRDVRAWSKVVRGLSLVCLTRAAIRDAWQVRGRSALEAAYKKFYPGDPSLLSDDLITLLLENPDADAASADARVPRVLRMLTVQVRRLEDRIEDLETAVTDMKAPPRKGGGAPRKTTIAKAPLFELRALAIEAGLDYRGLQIEMLRDRLRQEYRYD